MYMNIASSQNDNSKPGKHFAAQLADFDILYAETQTKVNGWRLETINVVYIILFA